MVHWYLNDDTCALTYLESYITGSPLTDTFIGRLISPIYLVSDPMVHLGLGILMGLSVVKLMYLYVK